MAKIKIATVTMGTCHDKKKNVAKYLEYIEKAAEENVDLIVFPELTLQGMAPSMCATDKESGYYNQMAAELVPEGETTQLMIQKAKEHNMYICWGMTEQDKERVDAIYNCAALVGPEGYVGNYRKVHQPGTERLYYYSGNGFYVYETKLGRIGMMICYDRLYPEAARCLKLKGADLILCPTCFPVEDIRNGENDLVLGIYRTSNYMRALENQICIVDSNNCGGNDEIGYQCGHSRILNALGEELVTTGFDEGMAIAELDPVEETKKAVSLSGIFIGNTNFVKDLRPDAYGPITENNPYNMFYFQQD